MGIKAFVVTLVVGGALFLVGILIFSKIDGSIDTSSLDANQTAVIDQVEETTLDAFELGIISLVVLAAVVVIGALLMLGA